MENKTYKSLLNKRIMKRFVKNNQIIAYSVLLLVTMLFSSCGRKEREQLRAVNEELTSQLNTRDSLYNEMMNIMTEVESEINQIKEQEHMISTKSGDFAEKDDQEMATDIRKINDLIKSTNQKVILLSGKLDQADIQVNAFKKRIAVLSKNLKNHEENIAQLNEQLDLKDEEIKELNTEVGSLVTRVQLQTETIDIQNQELNHREEALNRGFFAVGTSKNLMADGLVTKEGGFLWLGRTTELQADVTQDKFTEVNIQDTKRFYLDSDKIELVTEHPSESYKLVSDAGKVKYLEVTDPREFWRISKYLVISVKS